MTHGESMNFKEIQRLLQECNSIKYAAYRTAAKLQVLQKGLHLQYVRLGVIASVFDHHQLCSKNNEVNLDCTELEAVLSDIFFFAARKEVDHSWDVDLSTQLTLNFLTNVYDKKQRGSLQVISAKLALAVLCGGRLQEKYDFFFRQLVDHNNCITRRKMECLLRNLTRIVEYLSESSSFGSVFIGEAVESCFKECTLAITEEAFKGWLLSEPRIIIWMSTLNRMKSAEGVNHSVKCAVCKTYPMHGLRYQCLQCLRYDLCQHCFFTGRLSKRHKLKHPMQEYCRETTSREATWAFIKMLKNKICRGSSRLHYLPVQPCDSLLKNGEHQSTQSVLGNTEQETMGAIDDMELSVRTVLHGSRLTLEQNPQRELQSIIMHLEEEDKQLQEEIDNLYSQERTELGHLGECLQDHRSQVQAQIKRLKQLKRYLQKLQPKAVSNLQQLESTPLATHGRAYFDVSPIIRDGQSGENHLGTKYVKNEVQSGYPCTNGDVGLLPSLSECSPSDLSTFLKKSGAESSKLTCFSSSREESGTLEEIEDDMNTILEKLERMMASDAILEESIQSGEEEYLREAVNEIEHLLSQLIVGVENKKKKEQSVS